MTHGLVLGKFMPPHLGHLYLTEFAQHYADKVTIVVGTMAGEPIPGQLRYQWMRKLFPELNVVHLTDDNPQLPLDHPDFWGIWRRSLQRVVAEPVDLLFASEDYGARLAQELNARFVPTNGLRELFPISATEIREDPMANWRWLPRPVRPYFLKRISIFGPESTGKTTLAQGLADHFSTLWVPEYARTWLEPKNGQVEAQDFEVIIKGQRAAEEAIALSADRLLFCDTDPLLTTLWSEELVGQPISSALRDACLRPYDLTLLTDVDIAWQGDAVRYRPQQREEFRQRCERLLASNDRGYRLVRGTGKARLETAVAHVVEALGERPP